MLSRRPIAFVLLVLTLASYRYVTHQDKSIDALELAKSMANSEMKRNPEAWMIDFVENPKWGYTQGLVGMAFQDLSDYSGESCYIEYIKETYYDVLINSDGIISGYKLNDFNIDKINSGKALFDLYEETNDERYKKVMDTLRRQMELHPRTNDGGFWHKKRYTHQMWLDGIYMASPFLARYGETFDEPELYDEAIHQILTVQKHTYDPNTGLNYHGWDESKTQKWADPKTGKSPNFWGRAQGWYAMAIIDVLDYIPENHENRNEIISILQKMIDAVLEVRDPKTGLWYQVLDQESKEGNYLESTCSSMFTYVLLKALNKGYINDSYKEEALLTYNRLVDLFIKENKDDTISITKCCAVSGLGGNPYRNGSFEYYISEPVRNDDPKAVGPFILASIEKHKLLNASK